MAPEIDPKSFGTFDKQATGVPRIPDSNPWISDLDSGFQSHGFHRNRSWIPSNDSNSVDSGFHTMDFGFHSLDPGFWIPKPHVCRIPDSGFRIPSHRASFCSDLSRFSLLSDCYCNSSSEVFFFLFCRFKLLIETATCEAQQQQCKLECDPFISES